MIKAINFRTGLAAGLIIGTLIGLAWEARSEDRFLERHEEGWFWYQSPPPEAAEPQVLEAALPPAPEPDPQPSPAPAPQTEAKASPPPGPAPLSSEWFRENMQVYMDRAIDNPTPENIRAYTFLERIAGIKAASFARAKADATLGNPFLDVTVERPLATYGAQAMDRAAHTARQLLLSELAETTGLLFFFSTECDLCEAQAYVLRGLADKNGFPVMAVSLDGGALAGAPFEGAWRRDSGQAARLGVTKGPALFLMCPPEDVVSLGHGAMDISMIEKRIVRAAHLSDWISKDAYLQTEPVRRRTRDVGLPDIPEDVMADPGRLADFLETLIARQP